MKEFFTILFFGKVLLLTPNPVSVVDQFELTLDEPIAAITSGANVQIDVSSMFELTGITETRQTVSSRFPDGCLNAVLHGANSEVSLRNMGILVSNNSIRISLSANSGVPTDSEFSRITISSCVKMTDVEIYWANHKK